MYFTSDKQNCSYHWCSSSFGHDMKSSKYDISLHALRGSSLCLIRFQPIDFFSFPSQDIVLFVQQLILRCVQI